MPGNLVASHGILGTSRKCAARSGRFSGLMSAWTALRAGADMAASFGPGAIREAYCTECAAARAGSLRNKEFRPKFEVHRIVVIPFAAPNEAVLFEDRDDLRGHAVAIKDRAVMRPPVPIIR